MPTPSGKNSSPATLLSLKLSSVSVFDYCVGQKWQVSDEAHLARLVAIVLMGQARHAAEIIHKMTAATPRYKDLALRQDAIYRLTIRGEDAERRVASKSHRDGLIFEVISWIAAQQAASEQVLIRDPHVSATTQGFDGLMIELDASQRQIVRATIFEDKCTVEPRRTFRQDVLPLFQSLHRGERASELLASAASLLAESGLDSAAQTEAAGRVMSPEFRAFRSSFPVCIENDSKEGRMKIFADYDNLEGLSAEQRVAATLVTTKAVRMWFEDFAALTVSYIENLECDSANHV